MFADGGGSEELGWDFVRLAFVPVLIPLNGLFVAAEFALVSVRRTRIEQLVAKRVSGARSVESALSNLTRTIAATQLGITLTSIALGFISEPALVDVIEPLFSFLPGPWRGAATHTVSSAIALIAITFLHVVFGELIPKTMALHLLKLAVGIEDIDHLRQVRTARSAERGG